MVTIFELATLLQSCILNRIAFKGGVCEFQKKMETEGDLSEFLGLWSQVVSAVGPIERQMIQLEGAVPKKKLAGSTETVLYR